MTTKEQINSILGDFLRNEEFVKLWWGLKIPGLGMARPIEVFETDPDRVLEYVRSYSETSFM